LEVKNLKSIRIANVDDLKPGNLKAYNPEGLDILVANLGGQYFAIGNKCTHMGGDLSRGQLSGNIVKCPRHGAQFDVTTGKRISGPAKNDVPVYKIKVEGKDLILEI
jgi:nitrite reductase/ring-hydroxylating ferredoxin subunit